jgi:hypothetical protein
VSEATPLAVFALEALDDRLAKDRAIVIDLVCVCLVSVCLVSVCLVSRSENRSRVFRNDFGEIDYSRLRFCPRSYGCRSENFDIVLGIVSIWPLINIDYSSQVYWMEFDTQIDRNLFFLFLLWLQSH